MYDSHAGCRPKGMSLKGVLELQENPRVQEPPCIQKKLSFIMHKGSFHKGDFESTQIIIF
jgi:hypothetical protein